MNISHDLDNVTQIRDVFQRTRSNWGKIYSPFHLSEP